MMGRAAVAMWWDIAPERQGEFEDWHTHEHMPERLAIPGFRRGTRWIALSGEPSYFILYEAAEFAALTGGAYLERLNNPTPWSRQMMPHHRNMVRSLCRVRASFGGLVAHAMATLRFPADPGLALDALPGRPGLAGAHLLEAQPMAAAPTTEQKIRGNDGSADWVLLLSGYDAPAVEAAARQAGGTLAGLYRPSYSLASGDL